MPSCSQFLFRFITSPSNPLQATGSSATRSSSPSWSSGWCAAWRSPRTWASRGWCAPCGSAPRTRPGTSPHRRHSGSVEEEKELEPPPLPSHTLSPLPTTRFRRVQVDDECSRLVRLQLRGASSVISACCSSSNSQYSDGWRMAWPRFSPGSSPSQPLFIFVTGLNVYFEPHHTGNAAKHLFFPSA